MAEDTSVIQTQTKVNKYNYIHERNDVCLRISPFDSFKKIALYTLNDDNTYSEFDVVRGENFNYYLQFGDTGKTVRVDEYTDEYIENGNIVTFAPNEIMFKITREKARQILSLNSDVFYVVREIINFDNDYNAVVDSAQEIFSGKWGENMSYQNINYQNKINEQQTDIERLLTTLNDANKEIIDLNKEIIKLTTELERLKEFEKYKDMYENLSNSIEAADEYTATAISNNAKYINVNIDDEELANNVNKYLDENFYNE